MIRYLVAILCFATVITANAEWYDYYDYYDAREYGPNPYYSYPVHGGVYYYKYGPCLEEPGIFDTLYYDRYYR